VTKLPSSFNFARDLDEDQKRCCMLLDSLGSFESDIKMVMSMFQLKSRLVSLFEQPAVMHIYHCLDQHSICEIAFLYLGEEKQTQQIFQAIWQRGTGINSRKQAFAVDVHVGNAQRWMWNLKTFGNRLELPASSDEFKMKMDLDRGWIAGMIGPMSHKIGSQELLSFYDPENIDRVISIRRPSRDSDLLISDEMKDKAALQVVSEHSVKPRRFECKLLKANFECLYRNGDFECKDLSSGKVFSWNKFCSCDFYFPVLQSFAVPASNDFNSIVDRVCSWKSKSGVCANALELIQNYILSKSNAFLMRLSMYLRPISSQIHMHKLSRDGSGAYLMTDPMDNDVFRFLLFVCCVAPGIVDFLPGTFGFEVRHFAYFSLIRKLVFDLVETSDQHPWSVQPVNQRQLQSNQIGAIETILDRIATGRRGHLLWMDVGLGKTQIVLSVIESLIREVRMPRYCIFVITPSSESNIVNQIGLMGLKANKLDPRKSSLTRNVVLKDNCVNIVYHDFMDDLHAELKAIAGNAFFLFDEVHYMFGDSKRSSVALELAKTCNLFVAMTGTLVRNKDIQKDHVIDWLSQVVNFEITSQNYMIGVASLVSGKRELPIKQSRVELEVPVLDPAYYDFVDSHFGGSAAKVDYHSAAMICFDSIFHGIKNRVIEHRRLNHGCVFVVAKDKRMQKMLHDDLSALNFKCFSVASDNSISIQSDHNPQGYEVVIATPKLETGYDVTAARYMITAPYPTNEASRIQLVGRIVRLSQKAPEVFIEVLHCGILSYSMRHHEVARQISKSLSGMQKNV
jgi:hypothetical protein